MRLAAMVFAACALAAVGTTRAQDSRAWLEAQGLEAVDAKPYEEFEAVVARVKGAPDAEAAGERVIVFRQGKPAWQSDPAQAPPGTRWTLHEVGRDLDGDGHPDVHFSSFSGGSTCCTTHEVYALEPRVRRLAVYEAGVIGGGEFVAVAGRAQPVMVSADDAPAHAFAPYANSYFPLVVLQVGRKGRLDLARDLMASRLPGQPPPVCAAALAKANAWLRERCAEFTGSRRLARTAEVKARLARLKAERASDKLAWDDYFGSGVLGTVAAEVNRYTYTGHGDAGLRWLETVWPGNDAVKVRFLATLRRTQARSAFAADLAAMAREGG